MSVPFKGKINVDIRDSVPDWSPFEPPKAPEGAASVVYVVLDAVAVHEPHLDDGALGHAQRGIHHALDLAANPTNAILPSASSVRRRKRTVGV